MLIIVNSAKLDVYARPLTWIVSMTQKVMKSWQKVFTDLHRACWTKNASRYILSEHTIYLSCGTYLASAASCLKSFNTSFMSSNTYADAYTHNIINLTCLWGENYPCFHFPPPISDPFCSFLNVMRKVKRLAVARSRTQDTSPVLCHWATTAEQPPTPQSSMCFFNTESD